MGRLGWGVRGSIAAAWDVSGVAMVFGSTSLALAKCIVLRHFPADLGCAKGIRHRTRREEGQGGTGGGRGRFGIAPWSPDGVKFM